MQSRKFRILPLLCALALTGCDPATSEQANAAAEELAATFTLEGTSWQLVRIVSIGGFEFVPEDGSGYVIRFRSGGRLTGDSDCNTLGATWIQDGNALTLEQFVTTNQLCPPGTMHNHFVSNIMNVQAFSQVDDMLIFTTHIEGVSIELIPNTL